MITINNLDEMQKYYIELSNTYYFISNVEFTFDLRVKSNIRAYDIVAKNIEAFNINAHDIKVKDIDAREISAFDIDAQNINAMDICATNINAEDISYYAVCVAYKNINCKSIKGRRDNAKHFVLDGTITIKGEMKDEKRGIY